MYQSCNSEFKKKVFKTSLDKLINTEELKFQKLEQDLLQASAITKDKEVINKKCPVTQKSIDPSKISIFEGRKIGFCCDKCKTKFDADGAVFRSKIKDFKASDEFLALVESLYAQRSLRRDTPLQRYQEYIGLDNVTGFFHFRSYFVPSLITFQIAQSKFTTSQAPPIP